MTETKFQRFNWNLPRIRASLPEGEDAEELYNTFNQDIKDNYVNNLKIKVLNYDSKTNSITGSNIFAVSRLSEILREYGLRTAIPSDDRYGNISNLVKGRFYTDFNALILRTAGDSYKPNDKIAKDLAEKIENREGKLKLPLIVVAPLVRYSQDKENSYQLVFDLSDKTQIIEDERLDGKKYRTEKFNEVDDLGLPLFNKEGDRTWYAREDGLARLYLGRGLYAGSDAGVLACSSAGARVVLVSSSAGTPNFPEDSYKQKESELFPYTNEQLNAAVKVIKNVKEGRIGSSRLEDALSFLENLPRKK